MCSPLRDWKTVHAVLISGQRFARLDERSSQPRLLSLGVAASTLFTPRPSESTTARARSAKLGRRALFYTLIESAKLAGVNPKHYLREVTRRAIATLGTVTLPRDLLGGSVPTYTIADDGAGI